VIFIQSSTIFFICEEVFVIFSDLFFPLNELF